MRTHLRAAAVAAATLLLLVLVGWISSSLAAGEAAAPARVGEAPRLPPGAVIVGRVDPARRMSVDVALTPRDPAALADYATSVATPGAPDYRHYLSVAQFRRRFGPTPAALSAVESALRARGLAVGAVSANGLVLPVSASAGRLETAFATPLARVALSGGRTAFLNTRAPRFPGAVAGLVQGVLGLDDLAQQQPVGLPRGVPRTHRVSAARLAPARTPHTSSPAACGVANQVSANAQASGHAAYTSPQIAQAYGISGVWGAGDFGAGQTVGLVEYEEYSPTDVQNYEQCYGIDGGSGTDVTNQMIDGGPTAYSGYSGGADGHGEAAIDIDQVLGLAPAANIDVYEAPADNEKATLDMYTAMVDNAAIGVISTSWGQCEASETQTAAKSQDTVMEQAATEGKSVYAAAGDDGSDDCLNGSLGVDYPGSSQWVTSVGGTTMPNDTTPSAQSVWNDPAEKEGAAGGGISSFFTMPSYQSGATASVGVINSASAKSVCAADTGSTGAYCREVPDVAADADPYTGYILAYDGGFTVNAGTSGAAPLWAALSALANASSWCAGTPVGFANPVLYRVAGSAGESGDFTDITSGNNAYAAHGYTGSSYAATAGYDMASGLGTPNAATLVPNLCGAPAGTVATGPATTPVSTTTTTTTTPPTVTTTRVAAYTAIQVKRPGTGATAVRVSVDCEGNYGTCTVIGRLTVAEKKRTLTLGSGRLSLRAGRGATLTVRLGPAGRKLLAQRRKLTVKLKLAIGRATEAETITFKLKPHKRG